VHLRGERPGYLSADVELVVGDVRDGDAVRTALVGVDRVAHLAARAGVGQSRYEIAECRSVNGVGIGVLLEALLDTPVGRLIALPVEDAPRGLAGDANPLRASPVVRVDQKWHADASPSSVAVPRNQRSGSAPVWLRTGEAGRPVFADVNVRARQLLTWAATETRYLRARRLAVQPARRQRPEPLCRRAL